MMEALVKELKKKVSKVILSLEQRGFVVALQKNGKPVEKEVRFPQDLREVVDKSLVAWVDYIVDDIYQDSYDVAKELGFSEQLVHSLLSRSSESGYEDFDTEMGVLVPIIMATKEFDVKIEYLLILIRENLIMTIHGTKATRFFRLRRYGKIFMRKIKPKMAKQDRLTLILIRILDENNTRNFDALRRIEAAADRVSELLSSTKTPREKISAEIHRMKHALMVYMDGLWETLDVINTLRYGDPELLSDNQRLLERIGALAIETNYQIELAEHMSGVLASGLEVMQSIYNNQLQILNNKLALLVSYLTVIGTAVLVPNTIATIFGVPFFEMLGPEFLPIYLAIIVVSTVVSVALAWWWVQKSGLMPEKPD